MAHPQIAVFARLADGGAKATRAIEGQKTLLGRTMHGIAYDDIHDEIIAPQQFGQAILTFRGGASGEEAPIRVIQGSKTQLFALDRVAVDPTNNEIYVPEGNKVLVYPRLGNGDVAPIRVLTGPDTGFRSAGSVAVDAQRDLLVVMGSLPSPPGGGRSRASQMMIFDRTANGNVKPLRVISGPKSGLSGTGNVRVHPPTGLVFLIQSDYVGVWHIEDEGDVPPRYTIGGPNGVLLAPRGVALDPEHESVIVSDKLLNAVLTYRVPGLFRSDHLTPSPTEAGSIWKTWARLWNNW